MARKKPIPRSARKEINRGYDRSRKDDNVKTYQLDWWILMQLLCFTLIMLLNLLL